MKIEELTIGQAREIAALFQSQPARPESDDSHWVVGKPYLIRTVTMTNVGRLVKVTDKELVLEDAAWIADTGRFSDALTKASYSEVEPWPDGPVIINRSAVIDACQVAKVERSQK